MAQARQASAIEKSSTREAQHQQQVTLYDEEDVGSMAPEADDTLPTSTQMSLQEHMADTVSAAHSLSAPSLQGPYLLSESNSDGHLSVMSDGSFIHVEGLASAGDAECHEGVEAPTPLMPVDLTGPAPLEDLAQEANTVDGLSEGTSEHVAGILSEHAEATGEPDKACSSPGNASTIASYALCGFVPYHYVTCCCAHPCFS